MRHTCRVIAVIAAALLAVLAHAAATEATPVYEQLKSLESRNQLSWQLTQNPERIAAIKSSLTSGSTQQSTMTKAERLLARQQRRQEFEAIRAANPNAISSLMPNSRRHRAPRTFRDLLASFKVYSRDADSFDARVAFKGCIGPVYSQGNCNAGWAQSITTALSDRVCIFTKPTGNATQYSPFDLLVNNEDNNGCSGGDISIAHEYLAQFGVTDRKCLPFGMWEKPAGPIKQCDFDQFPCLGPNKTPAPVTACYDNRDYASTLYKPIGYRQLGDFEDVKETLINEGPIVASLEVSEDFLYYSGGIYQYSAGQYVADHAVKIIGFGTANNTDYWLAQNSWGVDWGEGGYFRIVRGINDCQIEDNMFAITLK